MSTGNGEEYNLTMKPSWCINYCNMTIPKVIRRDSD